MQILRRFSFPKLEISFKRYNESKNLSKTKSMSNMVSTFDKIYDILQFTTLILISLHLIYLYIKYVHV